MVNLYTRFVAWYESKPWWTRALCFVPLVLLVAAYAVNNILGLYSKTSPTRINPATPSFDRTNAAMDQQLQALKQELLQKLETVRQVGMRSVERRTAIENASTMDELDKLKEKYKL